MRHPYRSTASALLLLLAGCSARTSPPTPPPAAGCPTTPASWPGTAGPPQVPAGCPTPQSAPSGPPLDTDPTSAAPTTQVVGAMPSEQVAAHALGLFCDHDPLPTHWEAELDRYLSPAGAAAYAGTDPAEVPCHTTGAPVRNASPSTALATVTVPTDVGAYRVLLTLDDAGRWQVERWTPPPGVK